MNATLMECAALTLDVASSAGRQAVVAVLDKYGVKKVADLKDAQRLPFMEDLRKLPPRVVPKPARPMRMVPRSTRVALVEQMMVFLADASAAQLAKVVNAALTCGGDHNSAEWQDLNNALNAFIREASQ